MVAKATFLDKKQAPAAAPGTAAPRGTAPLPWESKKPISSPASPAPGRNAISEMQQAFVDLSNALSKNYLMSADHKDAEKSNPFGNFLVNHYVNNAEVVGKQFVNIDEKEPIRSQTATTNVSLRNIVQTIGRVGTPGLGEHKPDGVWGIRTNNALRQIYAIAKGLKQLENDMKIKIAGYDDKDLSELSELIPKKDAANITPNIRKLTEYYLNLENAILENPEYKPLITQEQPLFSYKETSKATALSPEEENLYKQNENTPIPYGKIDSKQVTLKDISTLDNFNTFLNSIQIQTNDTNRNKSIQALESSIKSGGMFDPGY